MELVRTLASKNKILGINETIAALKRGEIKEVLVASNYPYSDKIKALAEVSGAKVSILKQTNDELGAMCKKPFAVSVIGLK